MPHPGEITAVCFSPDGKTILTGCAHANRGEAQVWDFATGRPLGPPLQMMNPVTRVGFTHDGKTLVATPNAISAQSLGPPLPIQSDSVAFSADGKTAVAGGNIFEIPSRKPVGATLVFTGRLWALDIDAKGEKVVTASGDISQGELQLWNAQDGKKVGPPLAYAGRVLVVRLAPDGRTAVTGHFDSHALLWNIAEGKRQGSALIHEGPVRAAAFSPDGQFLVTGSRDGSARVWQVKTGQSLGPPFRHPAPVTAVAFSPGGEWVLTGCADGIARLWHGPTPLAGSELVLNIPMATGLSLSGEGELGHLEGQAWQDQKNHLADSKTREPNPKNPEGKDRLPWDVLLGAQALDAGAWKAAQWHLDRQIKANPKDWLALLLRSRMNIERNDPNTGATQMAVATDDLALALKTGPVEMILLWLRKFSAEAENKEQWAKALWYRDRMAAVHPDDWSAHAERASILVKMKKWNEAVDAYDKALATKKNDPNLWLERGRVYVKLEKWDQVAADFTKGIALLPETQSVADRRSEICAELAQWDQAMTKAVQLTPRGSELWIAAGRHHARLSQWDQAAADYARADWTRPLGDDAFEYACLFLIRGDVQGYKRFFERLIDRAGQTKNTFEAFVLARIGGMAPPGVLDPARAVQWGKQAVASAPHVPWFDHALALAHYRAGQFDLAVQRFKESQSGNWSFVELNYFGLAMAEHQLGHKEKAKENLAQGVTWIQQATPEKTDQPTTLYATDWLEGQLLRREAESLLAAK
jgi:tetratricopeptide (TPR) repeat protein